MNIKIVGAAAAVALFGLAPVAAQASSILVADPLFTTLPVGGLSYTLPGIYGGGTYSVAAIPGWSTAQGQTSGQFDPAGDVFNGNPIPGGGLVAFTNGGPISQTVGPTAAVGDTYTLTVYVGEWNQSYLPYNSGDVTLDVGGHVINATGTPPASGSWSLYTATYTAVAGDAGAPITIVLNDATAQGDFTDVQLTVVPEPATWAMLLLGVGMMGGGLRAARRKLALSPIR